MDRLIAVSLLWITIACTPAVAGQTTESSPVPDEYRKLISKDARFIFFMKNPSQVIAEIKSLAIVKDIPPPTLSEGMELPFTTNKPITADQFFIVWADELPQFFNQPSLNVATRIPADQVGKLKPNPGHSIEYQGQIAIFTLKKGETWKMPKEGNNPMLTALPDADIGAAIDGRENGEAMSANLKELLYTTPLMFDERMKESIPDSEKYGDTAVSNAIKSVTKDFQNLVGELLPTVRSTKLLTAGINLGKDSVKVDAALHFSEDLPGRDPFDGQLIDQLPPGLPLYMALNGPAARWLSQIEFDLLEGFLISDAEQVAKFEALKTQWNKMIGLIDGGITVGMSLNTAYQWSNVQTTDGVAFMAACNAVMKDLGELNVGITTKSNGTDRWTMDIDGLKIGKLLGATKEAQLGLANVFGGNYGTSAVRSGNLVMAKQYPVRAPEFPMFDQDRTLFTRLKGPDTDNLIVGVAADLGLLIRRDTVKTLEMQGKKESAQAVKRVVPNELIALHIDLSRAGSRQIELSADFPLKRAMNYFNKLATLEDDQPKRTKDAAGRSEVRTPVNSPTTR